MNDTTPRPQPRFDWFIPIDGDGARLGTLRAERAPTFDYLRRVAEMAEGCGFHSLLVPTRFANGLFAEDAPLAETWTVATALAAVTKRIRFLVAVRPGFVSLGLFAQMASTLHQLSGGRLDLNVVPGGIQHDFERLGEQSDHATRYARAEEFIVAFRQLWSQPGPVTFHGRYYQLEGAYCGPALDADPPRIYLGGISREAIGLAARQADLHLSWIEPVEDTAGRLSSLRENFVASGRSPSFGLRTHLVVRNSESQAWDAARELISEAHVTVKAQRRAAIEGTSMVGQLGQARSARDHRIGPHLWNGLSEVRVNCGTAIVGTPEQVAGELLAYWKLGIDEFILSGFPHVEECSRVSEQVLPLVRERVAVLEKN